MINCKITKLVCSEISHSRLVLEPFTPSLGLRCQKHPLVCFERSKKFKAAVPSVPYLRWSMQGGKIENAFGFWKPSKV